MLSQFSQIYICALRGICCSAVWSSSHHVACMMPQKFIRKALFQVMLICCLQLDASVTPRPSGASTAPSSAELRAQAAESRLKQQSQQAPNAQQAQHGDDSKPQQAQQAASSKAQHAQQALFKPVQQATLQVSVQTCR